jgi:hypothetical protein
VSSIPKVSTYLLHTVMGMVQVQGVAAAGRMPSMEAEPKTLTLQQLNYARVRTLLSHVLLHIYLYYTCSFVPVCFIRIF